MRSLSRVSFDTELATISGLQTSRSGQANVGETGSYADREYDDGYVRMDPGTTGDGDTWYWGYQSASQVSGGTITFHATDSTETRLSDSGASATSWEEGNATGPGIMVSAQCLIRKDAASETALQCGLSYTAISTDSRTQSDVAVDTYATTIEDRYNLMGVVPPAAPYSGTQAGPGPLLPNRPAGRTQSDGLSRSSTYQVDVSQSIDITLYSFDVGVVHTRIADPWHLQLGLGATASLVETSASQQETNITTGQTASDNASDSSIQAGCFASAGVGRSVTERISINLSGRYDIMGDVTGSVGPSTYEASLNGWTAALSLSLAL